LSKKDAKENTTEKSKKKLFVGGLNQKTTEGNFCPFFENLDISNLSFKLILL